MRLQSSLNLITKEKKFHLSDRQQAGNLYGERKKSGTGSKKNF
jgi:hypothetical protein